MKATAKIFYHGRSQAVRLPKEFRFEGSEVHVTKVGNRLILEPLAEETRMPWTEIDRLGDPSSMAEGREQPPLPADRAIFDR